MAKSFASRFRVDPGRPSKLGRRDPSDLRAFPDRKKAKKQSREDAAAIDALQNGLYAERKRALLVVLQGTDTAGKDGTIKHVFSACGPLGVSVAAFGKPSEDELAHDFLWRIHAATPRRGFIGIFNRSQYEDVLIGRVRELAPAAEIAARYGQINAFEKILSDNGTTILKFMLHVSREEQGQRLQARLDKPTHRWKFNPGDLDDRKRWDEYQAAYEIMLDRCSTDWAPWYVIPSDHKWARNAAVAAIVRETLEAMDPKYPEPGWDPKSFQID